LRCAAFNVHLGTEPLSLIRVATCVDVSAQGSALDGTPQRCGRGFDDVFALATGMLHAIGGCVQNDPLDRL